MPLYRHQELNEFLNSIGTQAKKSLSQNFLIDGNIVEKIVKESNVTSTDTVLEIGPGPGVLTESLLKTGADIVAVEMDTLFAKHLPRLGRRLKVIEGDFLKQNLEEIVPIGTKVVSNLPYSLTSPILEKLFFSSHLFNQLTLMVQKEVGERIVAKHSTKAYGALTLFCQYFTVPKLAFIVKASCFSPAPKVDSCLVVFEVKKDLTLVDKEKFFRFVRTLFSFRRKMISNSLRRMYDDFDLKILNDVGLSGTERCENLTLEQFISLFKSLP